VFVRPTMNSGLKWYMYIAEVAPNKDNIAGNSLTKIGRENSASIKLILLGFTYSALPKKSEPAPTKRSENTYPKKILNKASINKGITTFQLLTCTWLYEDLSPLGTVKNTKLINLNE